MSTPQARQYAADRLINIRAAKIEKLKKMYVPPMRAGTQQDLQRVIKNGEFTVKSPGLAVNELTALGEIFSFSKAWFIPDQTKHLDKRIRELEEICRKARDDVFLDPNCDLIAAIRDFEKVSV